MDKKKVIRTIFAQATGKDELRPIMNGVHFEKGRCYASDSKVLVIFHQGGSEKLDGKTMALTGEEILGRYPNVDAVIPKNLDNGGMRIDFVQLLAACRWQQRQEGSLADDAVIINHKAFSIKNLVRIMTIIQSADELGECELLGYEKNRASLIKSISLTCLIMPKQFDEQYVDAEREQDLGINISYENLINDFVFNSWKPQPKKDDLSWLD